MLCSAIYFPAELGRLIIIVLRLMQFLSYRTGTDESCHIKKHHPVFLASPLHIFFSLRIPNDKLQVEPFTFCVNQFQNFNSGAFPQQYETLTPCLEKFQRYLYPDNSR